MTTREYRVFTGSWKGVPVLVASHGVGAPGAILLFQELADAVCGPSFGSVRPVR